MTHQPKVGAFVLESLTTGMYVNPLDALREYVQNALDSIISAERFETIKLNSGLVTISLDTRERKLTIRDNGTGISAAEAPERLLNIGMSSKVYGQQAGFRGIGRLAGIAYCDRLQFRTSLLHEDESSLIAFDCSAIRDSIRPSMKGVEELADVLHKHTQQDLIESKKSEHFFEVIMEGVDARLMQFLDMDRLEEYLSQVAPVAYDAQKFLHAPKISDWARQRGFRLPTIKVLLRSGGAEREVFKPYKTHYRTKQKNFDIHVRDVQFYPADPASSCPFWMWYGVTDLLGMLDDDRVAGLRFRRDNIAIGGPGRVAELFAGGEGRLNSWTVGEIHVLDDAVLPNARRDGFESTQEWESLKKGLDPIIKQHCKACHDAADSAQRPTIKIVSSAKAVSEQVKSALKVGLASKEEREELTGKIEREERRVEASLGSRQTDSERQELKSVLTSLRAVKENLSEGNVFAVNKLKSTLDRKERKVISEILEILREVLDATQFEVARKAIITRFGVNHESKDDRKAPRKRHENSSEL